MPKLEAYSDLAPWMFKEPDGRAWIIDDFTAILGGKPEGYTWRSIEHPDGLAVRMTAWRNVSSGGTRERTTPCRLASP